MTEADPSRRSRAPFLLFLLALLLVIFQPWRQLPDEWNPQAPLHVDHALTPVTHWKLHRIGNHPEDCMAVLAAAPPGALDHIELEDHTPAAGCPLSNVVRVRESSVAFNAPFTAACPLAVRWVMFERQALQAQAREVFDAEVRRVDHFGSFACRNVYHRSSGRPSEHATASALDVATFRLSNGRVISVLDGWGPADDDSDANRFLRGVHRDACRYFGTVLGPDYNAPHANHFHLGLRGHRFCR